MMRLDRLSALEGLRLRAIRLRAVLDAPDVFATTFSEYSAWPLDRWTAQLQGPPIFIAVEDGRDVGMVRCSNHEQLARTAWLVQLWVEPSARQKGIAGALVDAVVAWARLNGFERLILDVGRDNAPAISLYNSRGFIANGQLGTLPSPRDHVCEQQMELRLLLR